MKLQLKLQLLRQLDIKKAKTEQEYIEIAEKRLNLKKQLPKKLIKMMVIIDKKC